MEISLKSQIPRTHLAHLTVSELQKLLLSRKLSFSKGDSKGVLIDACIVGDVLFDHLNMDQLRQVLKSLKQDLRGSKPELVKRFYESGREAKPRYPGKSQEQDNVIVINDIVPILRNAVKVSEAVIHLMPDSNLLRESQTTGMRNEVFEYRGNKDVYTGSKKAEVCKSQTHVDHVLECQLGAFIWGAAVHSANFGRSGLRKDVAIIKSLWNGVSNLNVCDQGLNIRKGQGTMSFKHSIEHGETRSYSDCLQGSGITQPSWVRNIGRTVVQTYEGMIDQTERKAQDNQQEKYAKLTLHFAEELTALVERMSLQDA